MRLLHFLRTEFVLVSHLRHLKYPFQLHTDYLIREENRHYKEGMNTKKNYNILFGMWEYGEINEISQHMRLLFNAWFSLLTAFCLCVLEIQWILHTSDFTPGQISISATRFRFHSFTVSLCRRVWKGDNLAKMAHFRSPLLFSRTPSPHTGSPRQGYDHKRKNGAKGQNVS